MPWSSFLLFNVLGGIAWATLFGLGGYFLGDNIHRLTGPIAIISIVLAVFFIIAFLVFMRRNERRLVAEAERALPGPLDAYQPRARRELMRRQQGRSTVSSQAEPEKENTYR